ncbi:prolyl 4-hydroxylase subunit alpha-2 [Scaptodrosophila lebanonensis]|uniref:Prolyl 4-hydroxylase subunit alpha-2 n=1 Tax=Drosophila lebanonensis TaxID=7225 RepID=A0A6J2SXH8_DROLE|nr:prolyl 4-hydroxylase subunit alpha-2 [Scaptodrosophila lebanonensis]
MRLNMQMPVYFLLLLLITVAASSTNDEHLESLLSTETTLIDALRDYIEALEERLAGIKEETAAIQAIHDRVGVEVEEYLNNPLNTLTILKRFESSWPALEKQANATLELSNIDRQFEDELEFPGEEEYEQALTNLLSLQSLYELEPASLSVGLHNGQKLGSAMSWSDCLEIGRKSDKNGDYAVAKYWLETALRKLPAATNETEEAPTPSNFKVVGDSDRARVHILEAFLNMEYRAGQLELALEVADELLLLRPEHKNIQKAKAKIEKDLAGHNKTRQQHKQQKSKSVEQQLIEELCRQRTAKDSKHEHCYLERSNPAGLLNPHRLEQLSQDPYIVLYHDVIGERQIEELLTLLDEDETNSSNTFYEKLQFTKLAQKKLRRLTQAVAQREGHMMVDFGSWEARRYGHEHVAAAHSTEAASHAARVMFNLQQSRLGGAVVFPQLELNIQVPSGSLLYWRAIGETHEPDYRSRQVVCPVLLGAQLSAWTTIS